MISKSMLIVAFLEYLYLFLLVLKSQVRFLLADLFYEGVLEDKISDTADHLTYDNSIYLQKVNNYLGLTHSYPFLNKLYDACLFWNYFCEQFGSHTMDPDYGIDALATFWDTDVNPVSTDGITMINNALNVLAPGSGINFESLFLHFPPEFEMSGHSV